MGKRHALLAVAGVATAVIVAGIPTSSAPADQRTVIVTVPGQTVTATVPVPSGTPQVPSVSTPVVGISQAPTATTTQPEPPAQAPSRPPAQPPSHDHAAHKRKPPAPAPVGHHVVPTVTKTVSDATSAAKRSLTKPSETRAPGGAPTPADPTFSLALPGPAPIGVPNFFIDKFRIPPFLLSIYQAAGTEYGIRWEVLAAINEIETDYGRNLNVSTAGAVGWMQFMPSTWKQWGVDANGDRLKDPYNPVDAIFSAARYLKAAGGQHDVRRAIFAYNHAGWYVDSVLLRARLIGGLPADFVGSLTGLTEGHFPVHGKATYADDISDRAATRRIKKGQNAAIAVDPKSGRRSIAIYAKAGTPVVAVQDGTITKVGRDFIRLQDAYGNTYTYGDLAKVATQYPVARPRAVSANAVDHELGLTKHDPAPTAPATAGRQRASRVIAHAKPTPPAPGLRPKVVKERLFAHPARTHPTLALPALTTFKSYFTQVFGLKRSQVELKTMHAGARVIAGTILGRIGQVGTATSPHVSFAIRPAGKGAPLIDPKPILDGWKLLESTAIYRATGKNPFFGPDAKNPTVGQVLLMSKEALQRRVLTDPSVETYACGRDDIKAGAIDRRVLATIEFLSASGLKPTITALKCGHSLLTTSGNISEHSTGDAVDIAAINGIPILGHQGAGSITDITIRRLLTLQGTMKPHQIISLMTYPNTDNTLALPDHNDHIHVGFHPLDGAGAQKFDSILKPGQWDKLIEHLKAIPNPAVALKPSKDALPVTAGD